MEYDPKDPEKTRLFFTYGGFIAWCTASRNAYADLLRKYCTRVTADIHNGDDEDDNEDQNEVREELEMEMPVAKRQRTMAVTEETIATVMDPLVDDAVTDVGDDVNGGSLVEKGQIGGVLGHRVDTLFKAIHGKTGFCVDIDDVWPLLDWKVRRSPIDRLVANFEEGTDYITSKLHYLQHFTTRGY